MTVAQIISNYDLEYESYMTEETKIRYIKTLEKSILEDIILKHELPEKLWAKIATYEPEDDQEEDYWDEHFRTFDLDTEVFADEPYDEVYLHYINLRKSQAEANTPEYDRAANFFNTVYTGFQNYWNRKYMPISKPVNFIHHRLL